jgi:hypothetical protein
VRDRAANERNISHRGHLEVTDILAASAEKALVFFRGTDAPMPAFIRTPVKIKLSRSSSWQFIVRCQRFARLGDQSAARSFIILP